MPVVLYECETWAFILREKRRLRMCEIRFLRRTFVPKGDVSTGNWKRLGNERLSDLYTSLNIIGRTKLRRKRGAGHV
jgi:hypothetical protein